MELSEEQKKWWRDHLRKIKERESIFMSKSLEANEGNFPFHTRMEMELKLPCGHTLRHAYVHRLAEGNFPVDETVFTQSAEALYYWQADRYNRHRCELVSPENPMGLAPREQVNAR